MLSEDGHWGKIGVYLTNAEDQRGNSRLFKHHLQIVIEAFPNRLIMYNAAERIKPENVQPLEHDRCGELGKGLITEAIGRRLSLQNDTHENTVAAIVSAMS